MARSTKLTIAARPDGQRGLFATAAITRDEVLVVYDGPILDHPTRYSIQIDERRHIDGTPESNSFLNHSCAPSAYVDWSVPCLRALRDLAPGEEVTCNYLTTDDELHEPFTCRCGSPRCKGVIRGFRFLSRSEQVELAPFLPEFLRSRIPAP